MDFSAFFNIAVTTGIGIIAFFLKYCFSKLNSRASREELNELKKSIEKIENNIDFLKENTVRSGEFIRTMSRLETKIDSLKKE